MKEDQAVAARNCFSYFNSQRCLVNEVQVDILHTSHRLSSHARGVLSFYTTQFRKDSAFAFCFDGRQRRTRGPSMEEGPIEGPFPNQGQVFSHGKYPPKPHTSAESSGCIFDSQFALYKVRIYLRVYLGERGLSSYHCRLALFLLGYLWMVSIPSTPLSMNTYIDENALQPAQVCTIEMVSASFIFFNYSFIYT